MKEKPLMTSFFTAMTADSMVSYHFLAANEGWADANLLLAPKIERGELNDVVIAKMGIACLLVGTYALAAKSKGRWEFPTRKALQISNAIMWGAMAWNTVMIMANQYLSK